MMKISLGLLISFLGTWSGFKVMACKSTDEPVTTPPPPACVEGETIKDSDYVTNLNTKQQNFTFEVPSTVYVEVIVVIDDDLYKKIAGSYKNGEARSKTIQDEKYTKVNDEEVYRYARKFMSAVDMKFQGQFNNPKIRFILRKPLKLKT